MIEKLKSRIIEANIAYRGGEAIMSDSEYDALMEELSEISPDDELLSKVGHEVLDETRKAKLPIPMASMNKIKTLSEIKDWIRLKSIPTDTDIICTPKYDGLSLCVDEIKCDAITRGDGMHGQRSNDHYSLIGNRLGKQDDFTHTYGEVIMSKKVFSEKYSSDFANPRNLVAGLINSKSISESLKDCDYVKYGAVSSKGKAFSTKQEVLEALNECQNVKVPFRVCRISDVSEDFLISLFKEWSQEYEIDGLILEIDSIALQESLGRETSSGNPVWARAFKHSSFEQSAESEIVGISWNISKQGLLKPTIHINPIRLDGVTVSNVTGNNARFVKDMGLGIGAKVKIVRSGMVIPKIVDVLQSVDFLMPVLEGVEIGWNDAGIELMTLTETEDQKLKKIIAFFEILEADNVAEGVVKQLWDAGHKTIKDILGLSKSDLENIDRFGKKKAQIVFDSINKSIKGVSLSKIQHASGIFSGLGSKKLALLEHFSEKPTIDEVMAIEGFADISASIFVENYERFLTFMEGLPVTIEKKTKAVAVADDFGGMVFVFTGVRMKAEESILESRGAKIGSSVSKSTTHLVCKDPNSGSSKLEKAAELGVKIISVDELKSLLDN